MSKFNTEQQRAIGWYAESKNLKLTLSVSPTVFFINKQTGEIVKINILTLVGLHRGSKREDAKQKSLAKKRETKKT